MCCNFPSLPAGIGRIILKKNILRFFFALLLPLFLISCIGIDEFEKNTEIPAQKWYYKNVPEFTFHITDTIALYNIYLTLRHTDNYNYNNIWLRMGMRRPADSSTFQNVNLILANDATGWEGSGLNDIFEVRKLVSRGPVTFPRQGDYTISVAQIMRENPLENILNVGIRIEKVSQP